MKKKVLITGATGFAGSFLAERLQGKVETYGTCFNRKKNHFIKDILSKTKLIEVDLREKKEVEGVLKKVSPDEIYHLAAIASPKESFGDPGKVIVNNVVAEINVLEAARKLAKKAKILIIGSADEYGLVKKRDIPINEGVDLNPTNPYSVSKLTQDFLGKQYFLSYKMAIVRVRPFNHIGPRQSRGFVVADFAYQIARIEKGKQKEEIKVGNLEAIRDFTDVRDMVLAYELALKNGKSGDVYNIGSGKGYKIREILDIMLGLSEKKIKVVIDRNFFRPADNPVVICDNKKFIKKTNWRRKYNIKKTLADVLDYWRSNI